MTIIEACKIREEYDQIVREQGLGAGYAYIDEMGWDTFEFACQMILAAPVLNMRHLFRAAAAVVLLGLVLTGCGGLTVDEPAPATATITSRATGTETSTATETATATATSTATGTGTSTKMAGGALLWSDPDTGASWGLMAYAVPFPEEAVCPPTWSMPQTTIPTKFADYLLSHATAMPDGGTYWTPIPGQIGHIARSVESDGQDVFDVADDTQHALICTQI